MNSRIHSSTGDLVYLVEDNILRRCVLEIPRGISEYYYCMIDKKYNCMRLKYPPHITILRTKVEGQILVKDLSLFRKFSKMNFSYDHKVYSTHNRFYLDAWSEDIENLRVELGLGPFREGFDRYHISIARTVY